MCFPVLGIQNKKAEALPQLFCVCSYSSAKYLMVLTIWLV